MNIQQLRIEINWIRNELNTKVMSKKQRKEYLRRIKHKELSICFEKEKAKSDFSSQMM